MGNSVFSKKGFFSLILLMVFNAGVLLGQLQTPEEFLITEYGKQFTPHHQLLAYTQYLADNSPYVKMEVYGYTYEKRPLALVFITSPENLNQLEKIRTTNLYNAGLHPEPDNSIEKAIVWLSYSVHGNEAAGSEASMTVMHTLAAPDEKVQKWLENTVVIIDPSLNPDGYSRYSHWMLRESGKHIHPETDDREHMEPWPGGRVNHYLFDLNRDWAWQTQIESEQRMVKYNDWLPHVHADIHEMGYNSHYYFAPAAAPYHNYITQWQRDFQVEIGKNHTRYFDQEGWIYFTRESFDLFYPSYGDTYPTYHGSIGMTYEKGGIGAGRAVKMNNDDILTLRDRIEQHTIASLSTIEVSSNNADAVIDQFKTYFADAVASPKGLFKGYVIKSSENQKSLAKLFDKNRIQYGYSTEKINSTGYNYTESKKEAYTIEPGDMIISGHQPKSTFLQILMEPEHSLEDSVTYDITAWSLPYAYGVTTFGMDVLPVIKTESKTKEKDWSCVEKPYAYYFKWEGHSGQSILSGLLKKEIHVRVSKKELQLEDKEMKGNYVFALRADNKHVKNFDSLIMALFEEHYAERGCVSTGFTNTGRDLGGRNFTLLKAPRVFTISGDGVSSNGFGQVWHFFENHLDYPISIVDINNVNRIDLSDFDILVLPDGFYTLPKSFTDKMDSWISGGGKVVAIAGALRLFADKEGYLLKEFATDEEKKNDEKLAEEKALMERFEHFEGSERRSISNMIPGAIIKNEIDQSHPLTYGLELPYYYSLKTSPRKFSLLKNASNPVYIPDNVSHFGFIGSELKPKLANTTTFAVENKGRGSIVYMIDNPLYRGFWHSGLHIFANALFMVD